MPDNTPAKTQPIRLYNQKKNLFKNNSDPSTQEKLDLAAGKTSVEKKKPGRKRIEKELMNKPITVNFTNTEKEKLEALSEKFHGAPITQLIRAGLKKQGLI